MSSLQVLPSLPEGAIVRCVPTSEVLARSLTLGEVIFGLMRLHPRAGDSGDLEMFLQKLVEDTRLLFLADGAAVALRNWDVCRWQAKCGETGPQIGSRLYPGTGISAECLATGRVQFCEDTLSDPRFDADLCRQLRLRSMIVAPIRSRTRVEGILEAWSGHAMAFDSTCLETLRKLADFSGRSTGLGRGLGHASIRTLYAAFARTMRSAGSRSVECAQSLIVSLQSRINSAPTNFAPVLMKLRARGILFGLALSTIVGAFWYSRPASAGSLPARPAVYHSIRRNEPDHSLDTPVTSQALVKRGTVQKISQRLTGGQLLSSVRPVYPSAARDEGIEDTVVLQALVDAMGRVEQVSVMKGDPLLASAAVAAVKEWRYAPFLLNNSPIPMVTQINMNFKLK